MMKPGHVWTFSNGTGFDFWHAKNCCSCVFGEYNGGSCVIEEAILDSADGEGMPLHLARLAGYRDEDGGLERACTVQVLVNADDKAGRVFVLPVDQQLRAMGARALPGLE